VRLSAVDDVDELAGLPLLLTIRQAALVLDVCPAKAYEMAHRYEATGCEGLPVIRLDRLYRVPRLAFAVLVLTGRVVTVAELEALRTRSAAAEPSTRQDRDAGGRGAGGGVSFELGWPSAGGRGRRSAGSRRAGSVEQLRLLPED
jgi:hypothetical protein